MGIDPIGKTGGPGGIAPSALGGVENVSGPEEFSIQNAEKASDIDAASPLERLRAGEIDVNRYLDARVEQATAHLVNRVDGDKLAFIRSTLRAQLEQDPALADLVQRATSSVRSSFDHG